MLWKCVKEAVRKRVEYKYRLGKSMFVGGVT